MSPQSNWCRCTSCHAGYGWKDKKFDFTSQENIDCLVCHDSTGSYRKFPTACGHPAYEDKKFGGKDVKAVDLRRVARNIGPSSRTTCGRCHFYGGGGDGVKHGDLDSSLLKASKALDVHMDIKGLNYSCTICHVTKAHQISGRIYSRPAPNKHQLALPQDDGERLACESCHGLAPHKKEPLLNGHTDKVACQSCHIPFYARGGVFTKMWWDWSTAGKFTDDGQEIVKKDEYGNIVYHSMKGSMGWAREVEPEYYWYNGAMTYFREGDKIPGPHESGRSVALKINALKGDYADPRARIFPFKIMRGKQPYDPENRTLVIPYLFGKKGTGPYWGDYDWGKAAAVGMKEAGLPFSGKIDFIETEMYWPITHMVAPKDKALVCEACHSRNGRLASLRGFYLPGRDRWRGLDGSGWLALGITLMGIVLHAGLRFIGSRRRGGRA
ncbi:MAG: tetrathionate reductase family octaheme c-type cytochrome [Deltaproteobacteria bacterium]|nr:tetrathionate reductase family octaheme c-type cytochrome [Deltaproteobacteria bacterium]